MGLESLTICGLGGDENTSVLVGELAVQLVERLSVKQNVRMVLLFFVSEKHESVAVSATKESQQRTVSLSGSIAPTFTVLFSGIP